jgi:hypothetical protein
LKDVLYNESNTQNQGIGRSSEELFSKGRDFVEG